jgi:hypothetical protein
VNTIIKSVPIEFFHLKYTQDISDLTIFVKAKSFHRDCNIIYIFLERGSLEMNFTDYVMKIGDNFIVLTEEEFDSL